MEHPGGGSGADLGGPGRGREGAWPWRGCERDREEKFGKRHDDENREWDKTAKILDCSL